MVRPCFWIVLCTLSRSSVSIRTRFDRAGRLGQYQSLYALLCLDTHNNASALAERHLSELPDGRLHISLFGEFDPKVVARRLDIGLGFLRCIEGRRRV
jgi:hypothetical protein